MTEENKSLIETYYPEKQHDEIVVDKEFQPKLEEQKNARIQAKQNYYYMDAILQPLMGKKLFGDWVLNDDWMSGSIWIESKSHKPWQVYMTPFWEDTNGIPVSIQDDYGVPIYDKIIRFKPTYDSRKDIAQFTKIAQQSAAIVTKHLRSQPQE